MKNITAYLRESFKISKNKIYNNSYNYIPETKEELQQIVIERIKQDQNADLNDIDTFKITDMSGLFNWWDIKVHPYNIKIDKWDVSNVENMSDMFKGCTFLNCDVSNWNTRKVKYMDGMFNGCHNIISPGVGNWNISNVENITWMFVHCSRFNEDLSKWDVSKIKNMRELFYRCFNFEGLGLENWDTQSLESLHYTFYDCYKFNGKIGNWNTKKLKNISHTFAECTVFNQDLNNWDVSNVEKLMNVFYKCKSLKTKPDWYWKLKNKSKN